jgi:nucleoside-diphosphate-sugar epimerase
MSRVLITGGAGMIGSAVAKRLLADPQYDVRVADERAAPQWMREGCEIRSGDLRAPVDALAAVQGCSHVVHLAGSPAPGAGDGELAHTHAEYESALHSATIRAALDAEVERFLYVSSPLVFERAEAFPTSEEHLAQCPPPRSSAGFSRLAGERLLRAAHDEHGLAFTICRPFGTYGPAPGAGEEPGVSRMLTELFAGALAGSRPLALAASAQRTTTPTHVDDVAGAIVGALASPAALNEDFNIAAEEELSLAEAARMVWLACDEPLDELVLEQVGADSGEPERSLPSVEKAGERLGWQARIDFAEGAAAVVAQLREHAAAGGRIGNAL